jgi:magnesium-protoporphyrin IX monomethyl ester (oxidative) cyclase
MKIVLINPPFATKASLIMSFGEPLGLAYVAAAIEQNPRHDVAVLDGVGLSNHFDNFDGDQLNWVGISHQDVINKLKSISFDAIGITMSKMHNVDNRVPDLIRLIKQEYPAIPIIAGGPEITLRWDHYANNTDISYLVIGEGEATIIDLLDALSGARDIASVKGIVWRDDRGISVKAEPQEIIDVETIPWPARHLLPMETYIKYRPGSLYPAATILTSRACPFNCVFCSSVEIWGRQWRGRSAESVVDEIEFMVRQYGVKDIRIHDDNFCVQKKRVYRICDLIIERKLDILFNVVPGIMASIVDIPLLEKLRQAGLESLTIQLESGDRSVQDYISKKIDMERMHLIVSRAQELGMSVMTNVLLGFPIDTLQTMTNSVEKAIDIGFDFIGFYFVQPIANTRVRRDFVSHGIMSAEEIVTLPLRTVSCMPADVAAVRKWAITEFYRRKMATIAISPADSQLTILRSLDQLPRNLPIYVFGTARGAALLTAVLREVSSLRLGGFVDIEREGDHEGLPVYRVDQFVEQFSPDTPVILSNHYVTENSQRLLAKGFHRIYNAHPLVLQLVDFAGYPQPRPNTVHVFSRCGATRYGEDINQDASKLSE